MCYEELYIDVVVSCLTEAPPKDHPKVWPPLYAFAVVGCLSLIAGSCFVLVILVNSGLPATQERQLTLDSVNVSDSVTITIGDSDEDDDSAMYRDYRQSLHQFAYVLYTMPMEYPDDGQDRHPLITSYKRKCWRFTVVWGWLMSSHWLHTLTRT